MKEAVGNVAIAAAGGVEGEATEACGVEREAAEIGGIETEGEETCEVEREGVETCEIEVKPMETDGIGVVSAEDADGEAQEMEVTSPILKQEVHLKGK